MKARTKVATAALAALAIGVPTALSTSSAGAAHDQIKHVLLISVDGMHQSDLAWYVANNPSSELAKLASGGSEYTDALTADPSDSDPGGTALMTGADPGVTGIYYDDEYSHGVFPPGTTTCSGPVPGGNVIYDSPDDQLPAVPDLLKNGSGNTFPSFDEGGSIYPGGVDTNPGAIMALSGAPQSGLNPATYPVDPKTCKPIMPWDYPQVNTIFQVIHAAGMRTAWSDKHAIYTSFNGPGSNGTSIDDFFGPEIDSQAVEPNGVPYPVDGAWTADNAATKQYDSYKVHAVVNWIDGYDHAGSGAKVGTPAIYGMNFQALSTAEKLKSSPAVLIGPNAQGKYTDGPSLAGGYVTVNGAQVPGPLHAERARLRERLPAADGRRDPGRRRDRFDGDHPDRQARPVAAEQQPAAADRRRSDHLRRERRLGRKASEQPDTGRPSGRRRRAAVVAVGPLARGG